MNKIVILHGWTYSLDKWNRFTSLLEKQGFVVEVSKIPGLTLASNEVWDLNKYSAWLDKKLGNLPVILLGHSNGGRIAAYFTARYPEKVSRLILVDTAGIYHKDFSIQIKRFVFGQAAKFGKKIVNSDILKKFLYRLAGESDYQNASPSMKKSMVNLINSDLREEFKRIKVPTLIIWGQDDRVTPPSDGVLINRLIKNSQLKILDGARHSPFFTHPKEVVEILRRYLK